METVRLFFINIKANLNNYEELHKQLPYAQ